MLFIVRIESDIAGMKREGRVEEGGSYTWTHEQHLNGYARVTHLKTTSARLEAAAMPKKHT